MGTKSRSKLNYILIDFNASNIDSYESIFEASIFKVSNKLILFLLYKFFDMIWSSCDDGLGNRSATTTIHPNTKGKLEASQLVGLNLLRDLCQAVRLFEFVELMYWFVSKFTYFLCLINERETNKVVGNIEY